MSDSGNLVISRNNAFSIGASNAVSGSGSLTQAGTGNTTLASANTYGGGTFITGGTLTVSNTSALAGGALTVGVGTSFVQSYGAVSTQNLSTLTVGAATGSSAGLSFEIGQAATGTDKLSVSGAATIGASTGSIVITSIASSFISNGTYQLLNAGSGGGTFNNFTLGTPSVTVGPVTYNLSLLTIGNTENLVVLATSTAAAYWSGGTGAGAQQASWSTVAAGNTTNWRTDATSNVDTRVVPGANTDVFFSTSNPSPTNLTTTLDASFTINSLTFNGNSTGAVTINSGVGTNTLTLNAASGTGITMSNGAPAATINAGINLGASQQWINNSSSLLTINGAVAGLSGQTLTVAGSGNVALAGNITGSNLGLTVSTTGVVTLSASGNTYSGTTTVEPPARSTSHPAAASGPGTWSSTVPSAVLSAARRSCP